MELSNLEDKFTVAIMKKEVLVGDLPPEKGKTGRLAKPIFSFLRYCYSNSCYVKVNGRSMNL